MAESFEVAKPQMEILTLAGIFGILKEEAGN